VGNFAELADSLSQAFLKRRPLFARCGRTCRARDYRTLLAGR